MGSNSAFLDLAGMVESHLSSVDSYKDHLHQRRGLKSAPENQHIRIAADINARLNQPKDLPLPEGYQPPASTMTDEELSKAIENLQ